MRLRTIGAATALTLAVALANCRQLADVHELATASTVCASCVGSKCASEESACRTVAACGARIDCELGCSPDDVPCRTACMATPADDAIGTVDACEENACASPCAKSCGDLLPIVPASDAQACATCVAAGCCTEATTCGANADCRAGLECARAGSVPDVVVTCVGARHPGGTNDYAALATCVKGTCSDECAFGANWSCLGNVKTPAPTSDTIHGTLTIVDASAQSKGVPNLAVVPCYITDEQCTSPLSPPAMTDANGVVTIAVPTTSQEGRRGFIGYFEVTDPSGTYLTTIGIAAFSLTQDGFTQTLISTTVTEVQSIAAALSRQFDPSKGSLIVTAVDCTDQPAEGATFALDNGDAQTVVLYPFEGIPSLNTKHTDDTGTAIGAFLPPGAGLITATNAFNQVTSKATYFTRAGALSIVLAPVNQ